MKIADFDSFLRRDLGNASIILIHGPDTGLVSERSRAIIAAALDNPDDPFQLVRLDGDDLAADPPRLSDEALTIGLFGGKRVIWVRLGAKPILSALQPLLDQPASDCLIVLEAGDLKKTAPLRTLCERAKNVAAIICYGDESKSLTALAASIFKAAELSIDERSMQSLVAALGGDRAASRGEIEKLALYCHGQGQVTEADIEAVIANIAALETSALVDAVYDGNLVGIESRSARLFAEGLDPSMLLGSALRHALALKRLASMGVSGRDAIGQQATALGIFFKRHDAVAGQLRHWRRDRIDRAIAQISDAIQQSRKTPRLSEAIAIRALWGLALAGRRQAAERTT